MFFSSRAHRAAQTLTGSYEVEVVSLPEECDFAETLPFELYYIFKRYPEYKERIRTILQDGKAIGVRTVLRTPENILLAIHAISVYSQHNYIVTWLPKLLRDKHLPIISSADEEHARAGGSDLRQAVETIERDRLWFKRLVLIDEENKGIRPNEQQLMTELSELIYPLQIDYAVHRVIADNANERTEVAQTIVKALLFIGPIAHILERYAAGIGKIFAAFTDDLMGEAAELTALRGSGFGWGELAKRSRILLPVLALATYGAYSVEHLIESGRWALGGVVFGLSAVALSLTTAIQSYFLYRRNVERLKKEGKVAVEISSTRLAITQDFTNPARLGLFVGAALAPFMGILGAYLGLMSNGWVLAAIGSTESIVAGLTVILAGRINNWRFRRKLQKLLPI
ncbi:MAG: hypothetical protein HY983_03795 [Candidatus Magasanikbacteria bacterium]|nr:hypothetical protein [Candidatus Magasanikbacteria bacterium]